MLHLVTSINSYNHSKAELVPVAMANPLELDALYRWSMVNIDVNRCLFKYLFLMDCLQSTRTLR